MQLLHSAADKCAAVKRWGQQALAHHRHSSSRKLTTVVAPPAAPPRRRCPGGDGDNDPAPESEDVLLEQVEGAQASDQRLRRHQRSVAFNSRELGARMKRRRRVSLLAARVAGQQ